MQTRLHGIEIRTDLKLSGTFLPVAEFDGPLGDPYYIDGAISLIIDGVELLGRDLWDLEHFPVRLAHSAEAGLGQGQGR